MQMDEDYNQLASEYYLDDYDFSDRPKRKLSDKQNLFLLRVGNRIKELKKELKNQGYEIEDAEDIYGLFDSSNLGYTL